MFKKRMLAAADYIETKVAKDEFDMGSGCQCVAAHVADLVAERRVLQPFNTSKVDAKKYLGINEEDAMKLFAPGFHSEWNMNYGPEKRFDKALAVRTLRRFANTGKIIWR